MSGTFNTARVTADDIIALIRAEFSNRHDWRDIGGKTHLTRELGLDSMDMVRVQVVLEDRYEFRFDPARTDFDAVFVTPETLAAYIDEEIVS